MEAYSSKTDALTIKKIMTRERQNYTELKNKVGGRRLEKCKRGRLPIDEYKLICNELVHDPTYK